MTAGDVFVGRERELEELTAALEDAIAGRGRLFMLVGEPGIGKTRTAYELAAVAATRGLGVLWGRCPESPGAPPFRPWAQVIRALTAGRDLESVAKDFGPAAASIAAIVPEFPARASSVAQPGAEDSEQARFLLFDAVTSFLKQATSSKPLLVVLDDLHWADDSSLRLLEFMAHEVSVSRLLILGTYRDVDIARGHPLFRVLGELTRQRLFQRVVGLTRQIPSESLRVPAKASHPRAWSARYMPIPRATRSSSERSWRSLIRKAFSPGSVCVMRNAGTSDCPRACERSSAVGWTVSRHRPTLCCAWLPSSEKSSTRGCSGASS